MITYDFASPALLIMPLIFIVIIIRLSPLAMIKLIEMSIMAVLVWWFFYTLNSSTPILVILLRMGAVIGALLSMLAEYFEERKKVYIGGYLIIITCLALLQHV